MMWLVIWLLACIVYTPLAIVMLAVWLIRRALILYWATNIWCRNDDIG